MTLLDGVLDGIQAVPSTVVYGSLLGWKGGFLHGVLPTCASGDLVQIVPRSVSDMPTQLAKVVGFDQARVVLAPLNVNGRFEPNSRLKLIPHSGLIPVSSLLLGSVVDAFGQPIRSVTAPCAPLRALSSELRPTRAAAPAPFERRAITERFATGVAAIDGFCTLGQGQRIAIFAEPGVGKTRLISELALGSSADVNVIALIGERGREIAELLELLPEDCLSKTVVIASSSDESPIRRVEAAYTATAIAEYFRSCGLSVLLQMDSLTRLFRALREVGLAAGEPPVRRGYPTSVFSALPQLIERAGTSSSGSITAFYTVLLSTDLDEDPMVDEVKGLTDGHVYLSKQIAQRGRYPAVDISRSLSRLQPTVVDPEQLRLIQHVRAALSRYEQDRELLLLGGTADASLEQALAVYRAVERMLSSPKRTCEETLRMLSQLGAGLLHEQGFLQPDLD